MLFDAEFDTTHWKKPCTQAGRLQHGNGSVWACVRVEPALKTGRSHTGYGEEGTGKLLKNMVSPHRKDS